MDRTLSEYKTVVDECISLFEKKAKDYGTAWRILRVPSLTDQSSSRHNAFAPCNGWARARWERACDRRLVGIINYAAMALVQLELGVVESPDMDAEQATNEVAARIRTGP
ncbi:MAG: DUF1599 domain-containing protein [Flavobacteriales bacterium]